jgi:conjugal transfer pilus assembly protein TraK
MAKLIMRLIILSSLASTAFAKEVYEAGNGDTITASISSNNLTRIEIEGQKIVKDFSAADLSKKITKPLGQIYLIPNTKATFNLYVVSDTGNTYNLKLTPSKNAHGDSIVIKPSASKLKATTSLEFSNQAYVRNINYLIEIMYLNKDTDSQYNASNVNQAVITYDGLDSVLLKSYTNDALVGQVLLIKNTSKSKILLSEAQFYSEHTLAASIENPELAVNEFTRVFIVKEVGQHE